MFDIGWPELLVVAIVLIVVVGPKDLPPMLRAFGRTTKKLRSMASEFRGQFDEALREAELDDVKKTFDDARKLNPMQSIRDAVNPLKDTAKDIRADLEKSVNSPATPSTPAKVDLPDPKWKLPDGPPKVDALKPAAAPSGKVGAAAGKSSGAETAKTNKAAKATPAAKNAAKASTAKASAKPQPAKPAAKAGPAKAAAKAEPAAAKPAAAKAAATKPAAKKAPAAKPAAGKTTARARKPKQSEGSA
jgi:sec-independent protein translocase protein TatB